MKSKTSCFSKTIFRKNITHFWPIWCLLLLYYLFLLPFMEFVNYLETKGGYDAGKSLAQRMEESVLLPELSQVVINPVTLFLFSLIVAGAMFSYLYTSRAAYTMHAFPVTRTSLFFSNYLSGLLFLWMPLLTGGLFGILMAAGCGYSYLDILFKGLLMAMGTSFFFYSFNVLVAMCIGQLIALPIFAFILNFLFVGCKFLLIMLFASFSYGLNGEYVSGKLDVLSPLYYMTGKIRAVINYQYSSGLDHAVCSGIEGGSVVAWYALAAVVFTVIAYLLYQKRHLETAGNLISFSWILPVFRWGVGACFASLGSLLAGSVVAYYASATTKFITVLIAGIIAGPVFFFAAEMVLQKSFRVFVKKRVKECGFFALALAVVLIFLKMDVFGIEGKVPDVDAVREAYIRANDCVGGDSQEDIEQIIALHKTILSHKAEYQNSGAPWDESSYYGISVKYYMKDDTVLNRYYVVPANKEQLSDETSAASMVEAYSLDPERYKKTVLGIHYEENRYIGGNLDIPEAVGKDEYGNSTTSNFSRDFSEEQAKVVSEAFIKDVEAGNFKEQWGEYGEEYQKSVYYNNLYLTYTNEKGYENYSDKFYRDSRYTYYQDMGNAYIPFNIHCENIIKALIDTGVIDSADELTTLWEMENKTSK